jgi:ubiquinone/menaquinone biosynthesis C-methylase UbiE
MGHPGDQHTVPVKHREREWQERTGGDLQERAYQRAGTRVVIHRQFRVILEALKLTPGTRHLDLGCGVGHFLAWLAQQTLAEYHGLDLSLNSTMKARAADSSLHVVVGDAERLPYADGRFDSISCNGSAHHLLNLQTAVHEMYRVLAPGGLVVMYEPVANALTNLIRRALTDETYESPADLDHKDDFTRATASRALSKAGFSDIQVSAHDSLAYPLSGMYIDLPLGRSRSAMEFLIRVEGRIERWFGVRAVCRALAWRWLIVATKPRRDG